MSREVSRDASLTPLRVDIIEDPPLRNSYEHFIDSATYDPNIPIAIDFGSYELRAGYTNISRPSHIFPNRFSKYRDRKTNKYLPCIGYDTWLDQTTRSQARSPFDGPLVVNWDMVEDILQYTFHHLGVQPDNGVTNPIIINEKLACLQSQRSNWYQTLFESFGVPKVSMAVEGMLAFYGHNGGSSTGIVIDCGYEDTNVIPIVEGQGMMLDAKRINWGGHSSIDYLSNLLYLKYPYFPTKLSYLQYEKMYKDYCYVSQDYEADIEGYLTLGNLENKNVVVEAPFVEVQAPQKSEEELRIQAEKRKESGKRLQEQARIKRKERLVQKREEYEYFSKVKEQLEGEPKKKVLAVLQSAGFDDERDFKKYLYNVQRSIKKAEALELSEAVDEAEEEENMEGKFDLVDIPDEQLNEEQKQEKKVQKLLKANYDARQKAKEEKERILKEVEEQKKKDEEWRSTDFNGWLKDKRNRLHDLMQKRKEKLKLKEDRKDRKSQVAQNRMKNLANLAEDNARGTKRTRQQATIDNDPNDTFGANDEDWMVYNDITQNPEALDEAIEDEYKEIVDLEGILLEYDPNFTEEDTLDAQYDWRNSVFHLFLRGPRPHDSENIHEQHQMHINVERIRVPEVMFQPILGGQDQAGITEICETIITKKFGSTPRNLSQQSLDMAKNVWLVGGNAQVPGLKSRVVKEFTEFLPSDTKINVNISEAPTLDVWNGMYRLANTEEDYQRTIVTSEEYDECGVDYLKEHKLSNVPYFE